MRRRERDVELTGAISAEEARRCVRARAEEDGRVVDLASETGIVAEGRRALDSLAQQYIDASRSSFGVAATVGDQARRLVESAWEGTLLQSGGHGERRLALHAAIDDASRSGLLDAAAREYLQATEQNIAGAVAAGALAAGTFDLPKLARDVNMAVAKLKVLDVSGFGCRDFDNLQAVSKQKGANNLQDSMVAIHRFFLRLVELCVQLREEANAEIANDRRLSAENQLERRAVGGGGAAAAALVKPEPADRRVYRPIAKASGWDRAEGVDWARLFAPKPRETPEDVWLTPKMACRLHHAAVDMSEMHDGSNEFNTLHDYPNLPKIARRFWRQSAGWRRNFVSCYRRIAMRLAKGLEPRPNCTGEEMALHHVVGLAVDADLVLCDRFAHGTAGPTPFERLPAYANDNGATSSLS